MKNYILLFTFSFILLGFILITAYDWQKATKYKENIQKSIELTYDLKTQNQKHKLLMLNLNDAVNYDKFTQSSRNLLTNTKKLLLTLKDFKNENILKILNEINKKSQKLSYLYEDIKTFNAVIKNSISWLKESRRKELLKDKHLINHSLVYHTSNMILAYYEKELEKIKPIKHTNNSPHSLLLKKHMQIVHDYYVKIQKANSEIKKYDIDADLSKIIHLQREQIKVQEKTIYDLMIVLLISSILFLTLGIITYIKELKSRRLADKLKQELQQFVDALNESAIVSKTNLLGVITYVNDNFCNISGYSKKELIGKKHNIVRHPDMEKSTFTNLWRTIQNKEIFKATIKNRAKDGKEYYVDSVIIPILGLDNEIIEYMAVRYNVTELVYARDEAIKAQRSKDEFLSNMSHELRTPLNSIIGFSQILQRLIKDDKQQKYLYNIHTSSKHLLSLINDILDLSKIQCKKFTLNPHIFNPKRELNSLISQFEAQVNSANIILNTEFDSSIECNLEGDWLRISQVIRNLLSNAIKFTPANGTVTIRAKYIDGQLQISVEDSGIGINKETQERIFKPFEQADSSTTRKYGGTGLGLSISSELINIMNGKLTLKSQEKVGSTFTVNIPLKLKSNEVASKIKFENNQENKFEKLKGKILVAEDNKTNQMLIQILLEEFGLECDIVNDGNEAVEMVGKNSYDLILMDENMPNLRGIEAMKIIRNKYNTKIPIIALTANVMNGDKERFLREGMDGYISKPIDDKELYDILKNYII
jgi:PAS domain S-box-containing protein